MPAEQATGRRVKEQDARGASALGQRCKGLVTQLIGKGSVV